MAKKWKLIIFLPIGYVYRLPVTPKFVTTVNFTIFSSKSLTLLHWLHLFDISGQHFYTRTDRKLRKHRVMVTFVTVLISVQHFVKQLKVGRTNGSQWPFLVSLESRWARWGKLWSVTKTAISSLIRGTAWRSGSMCGSRPRGCGFESSCRVTDLVPLGKTLYTTFLT